MWFGFAMGSAFFAGITSVLAKCGIKKTDSNVATAVRTMVVLIFSWLCYYRALQTGPASLVVPIDKLSILVSIVFSRVVFKEKLTRRAWMGLLLIVAGTLAMLV